MRLFNLAENIISSIDKVNSEAAVACSATGIEGIDVKMIFELEAALDRLEVMRKTLVVVRPSIKDGYVNSMVDKVLEASWGCISHSRKTVEMLYTHLAVRTNTTTVN